MTGRPHAVIWEGKSVKTQPLLLRRYLSPFLGEINQHETAAPEIACKRMGYCERESGCDRGIDGISTLLQDLAADVGSDRIDRDDGSVGKR